MNHITTPNPRWLGTAVRGISPHVTILPVKSIELFVALGAMLLLLLAAPNSRAQTCVTPPSGLVAWWAGEFSAQDREGFNHGSLQNGTTFSAGMVGTAISFDGVDDYVSIPASASLNVGTGSGFTLECWLQPSNTSSQQVIAEWNDGAGGVGVHLMHSIGALGGSGSLFANVVDHAGGSHYFATTAGVLITGNRYHVTLTYDKTAGIAKIFINGTQAVSENVGTFTPQTSYPLYLGTRFSGLGVGAYQNGLLDEVSLYNRALTMAEIQAIYNAGSAGKCQTLQPTNCAPAPSDLLSWLRAEGSAGDSIGNIHGSLYGGTTFALGKVGQAFSFDGVNDCVTNSVWGLTNVVDSYTMELWAWPTAERASTSESTSGTTGHGNQRYAIFPYAGPTGGTVGSGISVGTNGVSVFEHGNAYLPALLVFDTPIVGWTHIAVVYSNRRPNLYINGVMVRSGLTSVNPSCPSTWLGERGAGSANQGYYAGLLDEVSIYSRALTTNEIQAIYNAGAAGKCSTAVAPYIVSQPTNQTVVVGADATFSVTAGGSAPLSYQWSLNGTNLAGATASSLTKTNVQLGNAGNYVVVVSNAVGTTMSSNAVLTVNSSSPCVPLASGLVSWWAGENSAQDRAGTNQGVLQNGTSFASGMVNNAFSFDGVKDYASIPASASLDIGAGNGLTIECWIKPSNLTRSQAIVEWNDGVGGIGAHFWHSNPGAGGLGSLLVNLTDTLGSSHIFASSPNLLAPNAFQHVAVTYDKSTGIGKIFYNGLPVTTVSLGSFSPRTSFPLYFGTRVSGAAGVGSYYAGLIDEVSIYNHALTDSEIQAIYAADSFGKCTTTVPPYIVSQPTNQTVSAGATATLAVVAGGSPPLSYQWSFNGSPVGDATNASLTFTNVGTNRAGVYAVSISNLQGSIVSSNANLIVNPPPPCAPTPAGMVGWWAAEGSANDSIGNLHGHLYGGTTFALGKVGQAFSFDGVNDSVTNSMWGLTNILDSYTMELWAWPTAGRASTPETTSGIHGDGNQRYVIFPYAGPTGGTVGSGISVGTNGVSVFEHGNAYLPALLVFDVPIVGWTHIAVVYSNRRPSLYINGAMVRSGLTSVNPSCPSTWLGERGAGSANQGYYAGLLDEVSIYDRSLSAAEIQAIYSAENLGKCVNPMPPSIFSQPTNQTISAGATATLAVVAGGSPPLSYRWTFDGLPVADATNASLTFTNVGTSRAGVYAVTVTNLYGSVLSSNATLTVLVFPPTITLHPTNQTVAVGDTATILATVSGTQPLSYQWSLNDSPLPAATNAALVLTDIGANQAGVYAVTVTNLYGGVTSSNANLAVVFLITNLFDDFDPTTDFPQWSAFGGTVQATNHGGFISPSNSLWFGGSGSRFAATRSLNTTNSWNVQFHLRFGGGSPPFWDRPELPNDGVVLEYSTNTGVSWTEFARYNTATFTNPNWTPASARIPTAAKIPAARFRWRQLANSGSLSDHWALDDILLTTIVTPPEIAIHPLNQTVTAGGTATFTAVVSGSLPLHYQWRKNGADVAGATNSSLVLSNAQPSQSGNYSVLIANIAGAAISSNGVLKVIALSAYGNGQALTNPVHLFSGLVTVELTNYFPGGLIFYTLDGSAPSFASSQYSGSFVVSQEVVLRAISYRTDFQEFGEMGPVSVVMVPGFSLSVSSPGGGGITLNPSGGYYPTNTVVNLTAVPNPGWKFLKWLGDADGSSISTNVPITRNKTVTALFGTTLNTTAAGGGNVVLNPSGGVYAFGSVVQITAIPNAGNLFGIWGSAASGNVNPLSFTITNANPTVSALFGPVGGGQSALTIVPVGRGQVSVTPRANSYATGSDVVITPTPEAGQSFLGWSGDASGTANPLALTMDTNKLVNANFTKRPRLILWGDPELIHREGVRLLLSSDPGDSIEIDWSTNLSAWTQLVALTNSFGIEQVADSAATNSSLRFYRALLTE